MEEKTVKYCAKCGKQCDSIAGFCWYCGSNKFVDAPVSVVPDQDEVHGERQSPIVSYSGNASVKEASLESVSSGFNNSFEGFTPKQEYKNTKRRKVLKIVLPIAGLVLIIILSLMVRMNYKKDDRGDVNNVEYTKGELQGTVYLNEWANLRVEIPTGWKNSASSVYKEYERQDGTSNNVDCGLAIEKSDGTGQFIIIFEEVGKYGVTGKTYLDSFEKASLSEFSLISAEKTRGGETIAGEFFSTLDYNRSSLYKYTDMRFYVRVKGKRAIVLCVYATDDDTINNIISFVSAIE